MSDGDSPGGPALRVLRWPAESDDAALVPVGFGLRVHRDTPDPDVSIDRPESSTETSTQGTFAPDLSADGYTWHPDNARAKPTRPSFAEVYFPLLAVILPRWLRGFVEGAQEGAQEGADPGSLVNSPAVGVSSRTSTRVRRVLYLVSGYGAPRDASHAPESNSTEATARLMKRFVEACYPEIDVRAVHSGNGVFRYDKNVRFVNHHLRPAVARERDAAAAAWGEEWPRRFKLTVALCDGTPARLQALVASFRDMRPYLLHMWQLKNFWHRGALCFQDVDIQRWARAEATPPVAADEIEATLAAAAAGGSPTDLARAARDAAVVARIVEEMKAHRDVFVGLERGAHELSSFWLRKTRKPVLAVLCVRKRDAERDGVDADADGDLDASAVDETFEFHRGVNLEVSMPTGSLCSERNAIGNALAANPALRRSDMFGIAVLSLRAADVGGGTEGAETTQTTQTVPPSRVASFVDVAAANGGAGGGGLAEAVAEGLCRPTAKSNADLAGLNPLRPCGACKEWLIKIAEVTPGFKVLMFSDVTCEEVFVRGVEQC